MWRLITFSGYPQNYGRGITGSRNLLFIATKIHIKIEVCGALADEETPLAETNVIGIVGG